MLQDLRHDMWLLKRGAAAAPYFRKMPEGFLSDVLPGVGDVPITIQHDYEARGLPYGEGYVLSLITAYLQPERIFEIGTGTGGATLLMARQAPEARIDTLDLGTEASSLGVQKGDEPIDYGEVGQLYRESPHADRITQHLGDSAKFDFSPFFGRMDLVLVDGSHTYEYVGIDSQTALRLVRPGGVIVWDDCHLYHAGVSRALVGLVRDGRPVRRILSTRFAVMRAPGQRPSTTAGRFERAGAGATAG